MTRFVVHEGPAAANGTHALVIGVGAYPHLNGGNKKLCDDNEGLRQLSSPPASARAFADWLINNFNNPDKPLVSVALLLSEEGNVVNGMPAKYKNPKTGIEHELERAEIATVATAVGEWKDRADNSVGNMTIFYFCGHGFAQGTDGSLLVEDYGSDNDNALDGAIDFRRFHLGMARCSATEQCFFIDACRASSDTLLENRDYLGRPLVQIKKDARRGKPTRKGPVFYASLAGDLAYARPNQPSVFTEALIKSLNGAGSDDQEGDWRVETTRLLDALDYFMSRQFENGAQQVQTPATGDASKVQIHRVTNPLVPVEVVCIPASETARASFDCRMGGASKGNRPPGSAAKWLLELPPGEHEFLATFPATAFKPARKTDFVRPAYRVISLEATP